MDHYYRVNKAHWDELADVHVKGKFYKVDQFKEGRNSLTSLEIKEVGDVTSKSLLHLQCHFGLDSLSWARLGAKVTGIDFSDRAIFHARQLAEEIGVNATFIQSNIYHLTETPLERESFDIIFTSYGALCWLHDLQRWARIIGYFLKTGGIFYIADAHPTGLIFDDETDHLVVKYPYFHQETPLEFNDEGTYADPSAKITNKKEYEWQHSLADIINSLIQAGLRIDFLHEFPYICWKMLAFLQEKDNGWWHFPDDYQGELMPLMFSLKAIKM